MHCRYNHNHIIAIVLIVFYLILPASNPAHAVSYISSLKTFQAETIRLKQAAALPCPDRPASDQHHTDCCEMSCSCACHAAFSSFRFIYSPIITTLRFPDPTWSLTQVYRRIFVPPQNT